MTFKKLPMWKDENPITFEKQQISMQLGKLRRRQNTYPEVNKEIKELEERYAALEQKRLEQKNSNQGTT
ncbi:hypothetical protein [Paenibacillus alvei]|uniref:hypothetical protein n=1 Tax=Paenibacillus alvei TaxID=44250 RepID=UPI002280BAF7|nr:hypothetical protein [Paenibacillus alvei]